MGSYKAVGREAAYLSLSCRAEAVALREPLLRSWHHLCSIQPTESSTVGSPPLKAPSPCLSDFITREFGVSTQTLL